MATLKNTPSLDDWKKLYDLMAQLKDLAPWDWMEEDDIFGIHIPETGELGFVSVMGTLGEHLAIAVYQDVKGLGGFWQMHSMGPKLTPEFALQIPQLQASFEDRDLITKEDRDVMKQLGLKYRGAQAWPQFRSYRPGCFPWFIEKDEAQIANIRENRIRFRTPNVRIAVGTAPDVLGGLPAPHSVFVGGSDGRLEEIIGAIADLPTSTVVVTAATLATLHSAVDGLGKLSQQATTPPQERDLLGRKVFSLPLGAAAASLGLGSGSDVPPTLHYASTSGYVGLSTNLETLEEYLRGPENQTNALRDIPGLWAFTYQLFRSDDQASHDPFGA